MRTLAWGQKVLCQLPSWTCRFAALTESCLVWMWLLNITINNRQWTLFAHEVLLMWLQLLIVLSSYMCKPPFEAMETLEVRVLSYKPLLCEFIQALVMFRFIRHAFSLLWMHLKLFYILMQLIFLSLSAACFLRASFCFVSCLYSAFRVDHLQFIIYAGNMTEENTSGVIAKFH